MKTYLYIAQEQRDQKYVKIGIASDVEKRIATLQTANPRVILLKRQYGPFGRKEALEIEGQIHKRLAKMRVRGEWFRRRCLRKVYDICDAGFYNGRISTHIEVNKRDKTIDRIYDEDKVQTELAHNARMMQ